jgi:hypothetical protein
MAAAAAAGRPSLEPDLLDVLIALFTTGPWLPTGSRR